MPVLISQRNSRAPTLQPRAMSFRSGDRAEQLYVTPYRAVHARHLGVRRLDDEILIRRMRAVPVSQAELPGREPERCSGEGDAGPGAREPGPEDRIDPQLTIGGDLRLEQLRVRRGLGGIVAAGHAYRDVAKAVLGQVGLEQRQRALGGHVGY